MSGISDMGQRWQAALKIRVIMIPLPENTVAGAASGDSCGVKGCCRVFRQPCRAVLTYSVPHRGRENKNPWQGIMRSLGVWGLLFLWKRDFRYRFWRKENHIYKLCDTMSQSGREKISPKKFEIQRCKPCIYPQSQADAGIGQSERGIG